MKQFEIYAANLPHGSETGTYIVVLANGIVDNTIFCAPIMFGENDSDKNRFHFQANTKNGRAGTIIAEHMRNLEINRISGIVDEVTEKDCQYVKEKIAALRKLLEIWLEYRRIFYEKDT